MVLCATLTGCAMPVGLFQNPTTNENLEGSYQVLAACTYKRIDPQQYRVLMTDMPEQAAVRLTFLSGSETLWEISFIYDDDGRQTRMEVKSLNGSYPGEHILGLARACAA